VVVVVVVVVVAVVDGDCQMAVVGQCCHNCEGKNVGLETSKVPN